MAQVSLISIIAEVMFFLPMGHLCNLFFLLPKGHLTLEIKMFSYFNRVPLECSLKTRGTSAMLEYN